MHEHDVDLMGGGSLVLWTLLGYAAPKGHFLSPDSLAKCVFFGKKILAKDIIFLWSP